MTTLTAPHAIPHTEHDPACYGCWFTGAACRDVCSGCGCTWTMDSPGEPNRQDDACEGGCPCHVSFIRESSAAAEAEPGDSGDDPEQRCVIASPGGSLSSDDPDAAGVDPLDLWRAHRDKSELELRAIGGDR